MDRRGPDQEMLYKMYDVIELIYILNRLTNGSNFDDCSKDYLLGMLDDVDSMKYNYDRYKFRDEGRKKMIPHSKQCDSFFCGNKENFVDKLIYFLKSLNE